VNENENENENEREKEKEKDWGVYNSAGYSLSRRGIPCVVPNRHTDRGASSIRRLFV
jgi:hypothetical protein